MKNTILFLFAILFLSCNNERELKLPQIEKAEITKLQDVSPAYLFYDETQPDNVLLNRKNLISTTNWLINVDKRLTLKQVIPHIKYLQEKKQNSSHKNENAKNYFTCHDLSRNNLGFLEFTDIDYYESTSMEYLTKVSGLKLLENNIIIIDIKSLENIGFQNSHQNIPSIETNSIGLFNLLKKRDSLKSIVFINYNKELSFQDYISLKSELDKLKTDSLAIDKREFIY